MTRLSASHFLAEFGTAVGATTARARAIDAPTVSAAERELELKAAFDRGRAEALAESKTANLRAMSEIKSQHESILNAEREAWARDVAEQLVDALNRGLAEIETRLETAVADVLTPVLEARILAKTLGVVQWEINEKMATGAIASLRISGPSALIDQLIALGSLPDIAVISVNDELADVTVAMDETVIRSGLEAALADVRSARA